MMKNGPVDSLHLRRFALRDLLLGCTIANLHAVGNGLAGGGARVGARASTRRWVSSRRARCWPNLDLSEARQAGRPDRVEKEKAMIEAVRSIPGVTAAGTGGAGRPFTGGLHGIPIFRAGDDRVQAEQLRC